MAAPSYIGKTAFTSGTGSISVDFSSLSAGTRTAGDCLVILVEAANEHIASISGFTEVSSSPQGSGTPAAAGAVSLQVFVKLVADGTEGSVTVGDAGNHTTAIGFVVRPDTGMQLAIDATAGSTQSLAATSGVTPALDAVTTSVAETFIAACLASDRDLSTTTNYAVGSTGGITSLTERHDQIVNAGQGGGLFFATGTLASAGGLGLATYLKQGNNADNIATITLALKNVAGGGGGSTGKIKVWNGSAWVEKPLKVWNGSAWVEKPVKVWNGSSWVLA